MTTSVTRAQATAISSGRGDALAGTGTLVRLILRRDRIRILVWIVAIVGFTIASAASLPDLYQTAADRQARAELMDSPATRALAGPGHGLDDYTFGAMIANELLSFLAIGVGLMSVLLIVRYTRTEEETGRAELVRATVVGRHAAATAALIVVAAINVVIGALLAIGISGSIEEVPLDSSLLFGAAVVAIGVVFAGVGLVVAQVNEHGRGAAGLGAAALGVAYTLRAVGDMGNGVLSWMSPIGWSQATKVYVDDRWWPLLLSLALTVALVATAYVLSMRRDVGLGLMAARPGPAHASSALGSPVGLGRRLQRANLIGWAIGLFAFGLIYGTIAGEIERFIEDLPAAFEDFLATAGSASIADQWFSVIMAFFALLAGGYAIQATLRLRSEETSGRAEPLLASAVDRRRWVASHMTIALVGSTGLLALGGFGFGITAAVALEDAARIPELLGAALAYAPVMWLLVGVAVALFGLVPRAVQLVWVVFTYGVVVGMLAGFLDFPDWMLDLSPFEQVPAMPAAGFSLTPLLVLTTIAAGLIALGLYGIRRRDLETK